MPQILIFCEITCNQKKEEETPLSGLVWNGEGLIVAGQVWERQPLPKFREASTTSQPPHPPEGRRTSCESVTYEKHSLIDNWTLSNFWYALIALGVIRYAYRNDHNPVCLDLSGRAREK